MTEPQRHKLMLRDAPSGLRCERCLAEPARFKFEETMVCTICCEEWMPQMFFVAKDHARRKGAYAGV